MNRILRLTVYFLSLLCATNVAGQTNAADLYWNINPDFQRFSPGMWRDISDSAVNDPSSPIPTKVEQVVNSLSGVRSQILRATHERNCDFILGEIIGPASFLRHSSLVYRAEKLMLVDTKLRIMRGDYDGAVQSLGAILRMASHVQSDGVTQSSLQAREMITHSVSLIGYLAQIGALEPSRASGLLQALERLDPTDPIGIRKSIANQIDSWPAWMKKHYEEGDFSGIQKYVSVFGATDLDLKSVGPARFQEALDNGSAALHSIVNVMETVDDQDNQKVQIQEVLDSLHKDDLAAKLFAWTKNDLAYSVELTRTRTAVAEQRTFLDDISHERRTLKDVANAAYWYARGTKQILEIPEDAWGALIQQKPKTDETADGEDRWRKNLDSALREFREGSSITNCDWSVLRRDDDGLSNSIHLAPAYIAGIWRAVEYLNTMSMRESPAKDNPSSATNILTAVRLVAHLAGDNVLESSCVVHELIRKLKPSLERITINNQLPNDGLERIRVAVLLLQPYDPCGYLKSTKAARQDFAKVFVERLTSVRVAHNTACDIGAFVAAVKDNQILFGLLLADMLLGEKKDVEDTAIRFAGATSPISRILFTQIVGSKTWGESNDSAAKALALIKSKAVEDVIKIEPPQGVDVAARSKQAQEEIQQLRSLFSEQQASQAVPATAKANEK